MNEIRSAIFVVWLYLAIALVSISFVPFTFFDRRVAQAAMRAWGDLTLFGMRWIMGIKVRFAGLEHLPKGPCIVAMKHQSMFDTLIPGQTLEDSAIVYKAELAKAPFFGWFLKLGKMIPVARETHAAALKSLLRDARAAVALKRQVFIFPEGTRQWPGAPPDYKPGVAAIYRDLKLPCIPVATNSGVHWPPHGWVRKPGTVFVKFLPPIPPGLPREEFMRELERVIETESAAMLPPGFKPAVQDTHAPAPAAAG